MNKELRDRSGRNYSIKVDLFISSLPYLEEEICKEYLDLLDLVEYNKIFEYRTRPKFEINTTNDRLLTAFKENNWTLIFRKIKIKRDTTI